LDVLHGFSLQQTNNTDNDDNMKKRGVTVALRLGGDNNQFGLDAWGANKRHNIGGHGIAVAIFVYNITTLRTSTLRGLTT
jgi:hypothetical protein